MIRTHIRRAAVRLALRRPSPNRIPLSGPDLSARDYFSVYLGDDTDPWRFLVQEINEHGLEGLWFGAHGQQGLPASVSNTSISEFRIEIVRYLSRFEVRYSSAAEFLTHYFLLIAWIQIFLERLRQGLFNRVRLVRKERIGVLQIALGKTLDQHDYRLTSVSLMTILYGPRWIHHPDNQQLRQYYRLLLDSLVQTGDMVTEDHTYRLAPQALSTLAQFEQEDRRHRDAAGLQKAIVVLTAALVAVGVIQAVVTYWGI